MDAEPRIPLRGDADLRDALARAAERGGRAHPSIPVPRDAFVASVRRRVEALRGRWAAREDGGAAASVDAAAAEDLHLAVACEHRVPGAWEALVALLTPRLHAAAARRGVNRADADALVGDVLGALALPASDADSRPLLETYAGAGSLAAFTMLLLARRRARSARSPWTRRAVPLAPTDDDGEPARGREPADPSATSPAADAEAREHVERAGAALDAAWATLTPRERLVVAWKHVDGRSQREIACALGIGEPRVSRLAAAAGERLRGAIAAAGAAESADSATSLSDAVLRDVVGLRLRALAAPELTDAILPPEPPSS